MSEPTISLTLSAYDKLRDELKDLQRANADLHKEVEEAKLTDPSGTVQLLHEAFHEAIRVVQFAVGNLAPETVSGWPHEALVKVADAIEKVPNMDAHMAELPPELRFFAQSAASYEAFRKERDANRVVVAATSADFGPQTAEAAAVHAERAKHLSADGSPASPTPKAP